MLDELILGRASRRASALLPQRAYRGFSRFQLDALEPRLLFCADGLHGALVSYDLGTFAGIDVSAPAHARGRRSSTVKASGDLSSAIPVLHSLLSATAKLYLDFGGDYTATWGGFKPGTTPAYDQDGDPTTFSSSELDSIREIWARVAEKYSPFNVDVTTQDPGNLTDGKTLRVVLGGDSSWIGIGVGGVAYVGGFSNGLPNTVFVFTKNLANGTPKYTAEAAAHEAGHGFGLFHQGTWINRLLEKEYNPGNDQVAPIMGNSYRSARGLWWYGTTSNDYNDRQNDMVVVAGRANGFGFRPDDHGNAYRQADAVSVSGTNFSGQGIIEKTNDVDYFKVQTGAGTIQVQANPAAQGGMLDLKIELRDAKGRLVQSADTTSLGESLSVKVSAGTYYLAVASHGHYGDVGQYTLKGQLSATGGGNTTPPSNPPSSPPNQGGGPPKLRWPFLRWGRASSNLTPSDELPGNSLAVQLGSPGVGAEPWGSVNQVWIDRILDRYHRLA
ncbi:MAG: zinc-dependent metalloprotease family protein [Bacillota bacterium]